MTTLTRADVEAEGLLLPNGYLLRPGGRIRVPAADIWKIPEATIRLLDLRLGDDWSPYSEVIEWPAPTDQ